MRMRNPHRVFPTTLIVTSLMISSACVAQDSTQAQENALLAAAKKANEKEDLLGVRVLEQNALSASGVDADRQGDRLVLHLKSSATKIYEDAPECKYPDKESECQMYALVAHASSRGIFVVARLYYESAGYLLVDDTTGNETTLRNFPDFSPSGNRVLVLLINDQQVGSEVQIWHREGHKFALEWSGSPHADGVYTSYKLERWPVEGSIELESETNIESH
jgi:hypothetical protein